MDLSVMVELCLSVPDCDVGLRDNDDITAFDLARDAQTQTQYLWDGRDLATESTAAPPDTHLSPCGGGKASIREALFDSIGHHNHRLVGALITRQVDFTARNIHGDMGLHVVAAMTDGMQFTAILIHAGASY